MCKERIKLIDVLNDIENQNITITIEDIIENKKVVEFGTYRGKELTWYVLYKDNKENKMLLLSQYALHFVGCNELDDIYRWKTCSKECKDELDKTKSVEWMTHNFYAFCFNSAKDLIHNDYVNFDYCECLSKHNELHTCDLYPYAPLGCKKLLENCSGKFSWILGLICDEKNEYYNQVKKNIIICKNNEVGLMPIESKECGCCYLRPAIWVDFRKM